MKFDWLREERIITDNEFEQVAVVQPKADKFDRYMDRDGLAALMEGSGCGPSD